MAVSECAYDRVQPASAAFDERNRGQYQVRYQVLTDSQMGPQSVANGALTSSPNPLPSLWSSYSYKGDSDNHSFARDFNVSFAENIDSGQKWHIDIGYRPLDSGETSSDVSNTNPLIRPASYVWESEVFIERLERDIFGNAIINKAGDGYDIPLEQEETRGVLVASWSVGTLANTISLNRTYENTVNSATFLGAPVRTVLCREMKSSPQQTESGTTYYQMRARFSFREDGKTWDRGILERGYRFLESNGENPPTFTPKDTGGDAVLLAADGTKLPQGQVGIFTDWQTYRLANYNNIRNALNQPVFTL